MSQLDPTIELPLAAPPRRVARGRLRVPGWLALLLRNRKSRTGLAMVLFMVVVALIAPLISVAHPNDFNLLAARQAPSWDHPFGTTDQGSDIFSQVVLGARRSLLLGAAAGALATAVAAVLGNDYPLAQALLVVLSVCVILANLIMDLLNLVLDPRLRSG